MVQKYLSNILLSDYNADFLAPKLDVISKVSKSKFFTLLSNFFSKNSILTKPQHFHEVFTQLLSAGRVTPRFYMPLILYYSDA